MSTTSTPKNAPKIKSAKSKCCADPDCEHALRNRYFLGKQLSPHSFQVEQRYALERRRLLNRAVHGWGLVYGFGIAVTSSGSLTIKPGLALDKNGRELLQVEELSYAAGDLIVLDKDSNIIDPKKVSESWNNALPECLVLSVHYAEQDTDAVKVSDPCQCEHREWNYTCETIRFSLQGIDCTECCKDQPCEWNCKCGSPGWCGQPDDTHHRGGRRHLCEHVTHLTPGSERDKLCEIDEPCGSVRVDLHNGVPLACIKLASNNSDRPASSVVEACGPRRLVKGNDLLFDLIQGCDLTRITEIGWKDWHRQENPVPFDQFSGAFGTKANEQGNYITEAFRVEFSRPVREDTLQSDCFAMTIMAPEREGGWWQTFRVPIVGVDTTQVPPQPGDPEHHVRSATIIVDSAWVEDGVRGRRTVFQNGETHVEIEVRGDFIIDCNGQAVDANTVGRTPNVTGNGTPGGTFLSTFRVAQAPQYQVPGPYRPTQQ
jgi:hypothetical protein